MKRSIRVSLVIALLGLLAGVLSASAAPAQQSTSPVFWFPGTPDAGEVIPGASSKLLRTDHGLLMTFKTSELPPWSVQTIWWIVFNYPAECITPYQCGEPDLFMSPAAMPSVMHAAGHVIGGKGKGFFAGYLSVGDTSGCHLGPIEAGGDLEFPCNPLVNPRGAEIHLAVHDHGQAIPGMIADMRSTFDGGCSNLGSGTGPNICSTIQASVHPAP